MAASHPQVGDPEEHQRRQTAPFHTQIDLLDPDGPVGRDGGCQQGQKDENKRRKGVMLLHGWAVGGEKSDPEYQFQPRNCVDRVAENHWPDTSGKWQQERK